MAEISFPLDNTDYGAEEAQLWFSGRTSGVFAGSELPVTASDGMNVTLGKGRAWLAYAEFAGVVYANTNAMQIAIPTADAYFDRIDRIVIRFDRTANTIAAAVVSGAAASAPSAPAITRNDSVFEISLAQIRVPTGATEISAANITDERLDMSVCGIMKDGATSIDTSVYYAQWQALMQQINDIMSGQGLNPLVAYPVGSIYMSVNETSPALLFGGLWVQLEGRFLLGASSEYPAGKEDGASAVTLEISNLPNHHHTTTIQSKGKNTVAGRINADGVGTGGAGVQAYTVSTSKVGGGAAHENMPPYLAVYMWKRVADEEAA